MLALLLVLAACGAQVAAPRDSPSAQPTAAGPLAPDAIYVRQSGSGLTALISVIDARTGSVLRALPNGVVSADRTTLYRTELLNGGSQTRISASDLATGRETRTFIIDGAFRTLTNIEGPAGLTPDSRWLVLARDAIKLGDQWVSGFAVVNNATSVVSARVELKNASTYAFAGVARDGASLFLQEQGDAAIRLRVWDFATAAFLTDSVIGAQWDGRQAGFATAPVATPDARTLAWLDTGRSSAPAVRVLDLATKRVTTIVLPDGQRSDDFEKYLLWSLALSRDGSTLYAVNPALGFIDELFLQAGLLNRTNRIDVTRATEGALASFARSLFPVAEAKRYIRGGAVLSHDGRALYAAGTKGIAVIDVATLGSRVTWAADSSFDSFALSPDGARLYGISDQLGKIRVVRTTDGAVLGELRPGSYPGEVVRVDLAADPNVASSVAAVQACGAFAPPDPSVSAEIQHLKTTATVIEVLGPCTLRVQIAGGAGTLVPFAGKIIALRATSQTTFASADKGDLTAIGRFGLKPQDTVTLSFDSRAFPDGSYPLNFMNR
jgi:DNA-binding beta-propeller fold protein YncE